VGNILPNFLDLISTVAGILKFKSAANYAI
jgi:hypothetical protein